MISIAKLDDLIELVKYDDKLKIHLTSILQYRDQFGIRPK